MKLLAVGLTGNALLVLLSVFLSVALFEFSVRTFLPIYDPSGQLKLVQLPDGTPIGPRRVTLRQAKNTGDYNVEIHFNNWGFRDEKPLTTATEKDLFVVGDSFAFGWGVNVQDRFSDCLQSILNRPVFNIGSPAADFDDYYRLVRYAEASGVTVKNLVISVTMENDLSDYSSFPPGDANPLPDKNELPSLNYFALKQWLSEHSALYALFTNAVHQTTWLQSIAVRLGVITPNLEGISDINFNPKVLASSERRIYQLAAGRRVVILIIPSRRLWVGDPARRAEAARVHAAFIDGLRTYGMSVVDMRDRLEAGGNPLSYHFANDGHWNSAGHRMAAKALSEVLEHWQDW
jgi:hypothetical protein